MIGFFDSGYGGLTVLEPLAAKFPQFQYLYLGDNARYPYGNRSKDKVTEFARQAVYFLIKQGAKYIFFACNTVSSLALPILKKEFEGKVKLYGVIDPVARHARKITQNKKIGVVGTRATINSEIYDHKIQKLDPEIKVYSKACPLLVPLVEESWHHKREAKMILKTYLRSLKTANIDTLILGCTHYPFMLEEFQRVMGKKIQILTNGQALTDFFAKIISQNSELQKAAKLDQPKKIKVFTTDCRDKFQEFVVNNLKIEIEKPEKIELF